MLDLALTAGAVKSRRRDPQTEYLSITFDSGRKGFKRDALRQDATDLE